jgi:SAM-dependent MidA family methyltransferase
MEEAVSGQESGLKNYVLSQIRAKGPIPFSQFMEWCLYHPEHGYYRGGKADIGKEGDYYTSPSVHALFGRVLARQFLQMSEVLGGETFDVVEMGGGKGFLCQDILDWTEENAPDLYRRMRYYLFETSPVFLEEQKGRLAGHDSKGKITWFEEVKLKDGKDWIEGCILSNELVDAFPVHRVALQHGKVRELYVTEKEGALEEQWGEPSDSRIISYMNSLPFSLEEGQVAEVNLRALDWMEEVARSLRRGFILTIDYGFRDNDLYSPHRSEGTLLCYHQHRVSGNPFERPGEQDITAHVNFTSLIRKGEEVGLMLTGLVPQYRFLLGLGLLEEVESLGRGLPELEALQMRLSIKHLVEPETGMGETFKVLIQHKGLEMPDLDGLRDL